MNRSILAVLLAGSVILPAWAQVQQAQQLDDDGYAPEHGVARISLVNGDVSVRRGDSGDLTAAALNGPLVVNDHLATGQNARAEIQFDWGNMIRLGPATEVRLGELEDRRYLVQIAIGTTTFRVLRDSGADVEISTPTVSIRPAEQGSYRVTVFPDGMTEITVRSGRADIFSPRGTETLTAGRTMEARGTPSDPEYMIRAAIPQDEWDRWNADRDRTLENTSSYRYVSPDIVGAEELDNYGRWTTDPEYGNVWVPTVDPGWAPYRVGRWVDEPYYGWTWVSGDPFGWAPYHYGNWYQSSFGWAWYPGPIGGRHYWRPALVGFFGWGSGYGGIGFGYGNVGWVPLHPRERFRPWYGRGYNNTNIVNVTVGNNYRNARFVNGRNGVTSINAGDFGRGRSINSNNFVRASNNDLARAGAVQGRLPFNGSADGRRMSDRQVNAQSLPRVNENTRFARRGGNAAGNAAGNIGGGGAIGQATQGRQSGTRGNNNPAPGGVANGNGNTGGFRRFEGGATGAPTDNRGQRGVQVPPAQDTGVQGNRGQIDRGQVDRGQVDRGQVDRGNNSNGAGWRRFEGVTPSDNRGQRNGNVGNGVVQAPRGQDNVTPQVNRGQIDRGQVDRGQVDRGNNSNGGFRRFEGNTSNNVPNVIGGPRNGQGTGPIQVPQEQRVPDRQPMRQSQPRDFQRQAPQSMPQQAAPQQPIRISPPIVRERGPAPTGTRPEARQEAPRGGFGQPRMQGGGGESRSNIGGGGGGGNNGGGNRGGGGGGESRGNGGGNRGGGRR